MLKITFVLYILNVLITKEESTISFWETTEFKSSKMCQD